MRAFHQRDVICRAKRVSVWYLALAGRTLVCEDTYDGAGHAHTAGAQLHRDEFPKLFAALDALAALDAPQADRDPRTSELAALYPARVDRLVFGAADPKAGFAGSLGDLVRDPRLNHRLKVTGGVLADEAGELIREFFRSMRG